MIARRAMTCLAGNAKLGNTRIGGDAGRARRANVSGRIESSLAVGRVTIDADSIPSSAL